MKKLKRALLLIPTLSSLVVLASCFGGGQTGSNPTEPTTPISQTGSNPTTPSTTTPTTPKTSRPRTTVERDRKVIYVSPTGTREGAGTEESPQDFVTAAFNAKPGDTVLMAGGTYTYNYRLTLNESGAPGDYITIMPKSDNDRVIFDFSSMFFNGSNRGIQVYGNYWHIYGIEVTGAGDNGMYVAGSHNVIENCLFYNNRDTGLQLGRGYSEYTTIDMWPSYNLIKNCTSFANYDAETLGENADGFAAKLTIGYGNVFDGCIAFRNSDDGWDMFAKVDSGNIGTVYLYNCVSFENGFLPYQIDAVADDGSTYKTYDTPNGDGIGFKLGGSVMEGDVVINNCMAFNNKLHGFGDNSNPGFISITNSTAFNNCVGVTADGSVSDVRGYGMIANKSNNIDLARSTTSYNSYNGVVSYINNQRGYSTANDNEFNHDAFRGSVGYSIFNTDYNHGEVYVAFKDFEDASSYHTEKVDSQYTGGTSYTGLSDDSFADLSPLNAKCDSFANLNELVAYHVNLRNADGSVNMGDTLRIVDTKLLTYANGNPIGANLSKGNDASYSHTGLYLFDSDAARCNFDEETEVLAAYSILEPLTNVNATFQSFDIPTLFGGCNISWSSSDTSVLQIEKTEVSSLSKSVYSKATVIVPDEKTTVTLTARIIKDGYYLDKEFEIVVLPRNQELGELTTTGGLAIRVDKYGIFAEPNVYAIDASSTNNEKLPSNIYVTEKTISFATSNDAKFYPVDGVYTSVPGVYKVTVKATSNKNPAVKSTLSYNVYVVDPSCSIDFTGPVETVLTYDGFRISGNLTNIEGSVAAIVSTTPRTVTVADFVGENGADKEGVQYFKITTDFVDAEFKAENLNLSASETQYYVYYVVLNANKDNVNKVKSFEIKKQDISTEQQFYDLARGTNDFSSSNTTIYSLTKDLDFSDFNWYVTPKASSKAFVGLFNGNGHTISNISITAENAGGATDSNNEKYFNVFYKLQNGTVMNVNFNEVKISNTSAKVLGIVGDMQGGYIYKVKLTNIAMAGKESAGGMVGQVTGGINYISEVSLVNPLPDKNVTDRKNSVADDYIPTVYKISATNKYAGGIIGNVQMNSDQTRVRVTVNNCYVKANIGDSNDAQGNVGGIIGRVKNDNTNYYTSVSFCYFEGTVISKGQYQGGMIGDFDNGSGYTELNSNMANARFVWNSLVLDADVALRAGDEQHYAHKNSNPMIGRAQLGETGQYVCTNCYGTWSEYYYNNGVLSTSFAFDFSDEDDEGNITIAEFTEFFWFETLKLDRTIWGLDSTTKTVYLK